MVDHQGLCAGEVVNGEDQITQPLGFPDGEAAGRLIEQDQFWAADKAARDIGEPALEAREVRPDFFGAAC